MRNVDINKLEPNSHAYKNAKAESVNREKLKPMIDKNHLVSTKKPLSKKFKEAFIEKDVEDVKSWFVFEVLIPGVKNAILDMLTMQFFGYTDRRDRGDSRRRNGSKINYSSFSGGSSRRERDRRRDDTYRSDEDVDFRHIVLVERIDAENIIEEMRHRIKVYGSVTVADLLDLVGCTGRYTDNNYGWDDDRDIGIRRISSGFLIDVSEPKYLE